MTLHDSVTQAAEFLANRLRDTRASEARVAVLLGSGLGGVTDRVEAELELPYSEIPGLPATSVEGHRGRVVAGLLGGAPALVFEGRVHGYEDFTPAQTTFAIRVMAAVGIRTVLITNAAGGIRESFHTGDLVAIADHINLTGVNPAAGPHEEQLGPRFFDMSRAYDPELRALAIRTAAQQGWQMPEGVYVGVQGPSFETPAEIRAFRSMGGDLVGMSTVHEVIIARQCGLRVLGISCVTNLAAGVVDQPLRHGEVMEAGAAASGKLADLIAALAPQLV